MTRGFQDKPLSEQIKEMQALTKQNPIQEWKWEQRERLERILKKHVQSAPVRHKILYEMFGD